MGGRGGGPGGGAVRAGWSLMVPALCLAEGPAGLCMCTWSVCTDCTGQVTAPTGQVHERNGVGMQTWQQWPQAALPTFKRYYLLNQAQLLLCTACALRPLPPRVYHLYLVCTPGTHD